MKTSFDAIDIIWKRLNTSFASSITGEVCKQTRPLNSTKEDIVINSITLSSDQLQEGVLNVNIHVPNLSLTINGATDNTQPDFARLKALTTSVISSLTDEWEPEDGYFIDVQDPGHLIQEQDTFSYYSNIRIEFFSPNI